MGRLWDFGRKSKKRVGRDGGVTDRSDQPVDVLNDSEDGCSPEELYDFMSADALDVQADPRFKEALRRKLWAMVNDRYGRGTRHKL